MTEPAKTIRGVDAEGRGVSAELSRPEFSAEQSMWIATIQCPALFESDKSVAGVDAAQALELAEVLVTELFDHRGISPT